MFRERNAMNIGARFVHLINMQFALTPKDSMSVAVAYNQFTSCIENVVCNNWFRWMRLRVLDVHHCINFLSLLLAFFLAKFQMAFEVFDLIQETGCIYLWKKSTTRCGHPLNTIQCQPTEPTAQARYGKTSHAKSCEHWFSETSTWTNVCYHASEEMGLCEL